MRKRISERVKDFHHDERGVVAIFNMLIAIGISIAVIFVLYGVVIPQVGSEAEETMDLNHSSNWYFIQHNMSSNVLSWIGSVNLVVVISLLALVIMAVAGMMYGYGGQKGQM